MNKFVEEESSHVYSFQANFSCKEYGTNEDLKFSNRDEPIHPALCPQPNLNFISIPLVSPPPSCSPSHTQTCRVLYHPNVHNDIAVQSIARTSWDQNHANIMPRGHMLMEFFQDNLNPNTNSVRKVCPVVTPARNGEEAMLPPHIFSDELTVDMNELILILIWAMTTSLNLSLSILIL